MTSKADLVRRSKGCVARVVLPEGDDPRIQEAAVLAARQGIAEVTVICDHAVALDGVRVVTTAEMSERYRDEILAKLQRDPSGDAPAIGALECGAQAVAAGDADGAVMGAVATTADVLRAALRLVGTTGGLVSSSFLMAMPPSGEGAVRTMLFADPAVVPDPDSQQLAEIGRATVGTWRALSDEAPRVAFLSFSTRGSAKHPRVEKVRAATELFRQSCPDVECDGEIQADAALVPEIASRKCPDSSLAGRANILVFPDLDSGNIGYKLTERLAGATAVGPILQGLRRPIQDLSRGCSASDVVDVIAITALLGGSPGSQP